MIDIDNELLKIKAKLTDNEQPTFLTTEQIKNIKCYNRDLSQIMIGLAIKDSEYASNNGVDLYSILIDVNEIQKQCQNQDLNEDLVIKSTLCHELIHVLAVGFAEETEISETEARYKDEAYTEKYAEELFRKVYEKEQYYSAYASLGDTNYALQVELMDADKNRLRYFSGQVN